MLCVVSINSTSTFFVLCFLLDLVTPKFHYILAATTTADAFHICLASPFSLKSLHIRLSPQSKTCERLLEPEQQHQSREGIFLHNLKVPMLVPVLFLQVCYSVESVDLLWMCDVYWVQYYNTAIAVNAIQNSNEKLYLLVV